jgi:uncharacterized membrane protein
VGSPLSILDYRQPVEFRIGDVIVRTWTVLSRHFLTFLLLVGIAELIPLVVTLYLGEAAEVAKAKDFRALFLALPLGLLQFILVAFAQAIVVHAAFQDLRGRQVSATESFQHGVQRLFPVLVASVLSGLMMVVGLILCLIPGLIAIAALAVVLPACVVERLGPIDSISRSIDLTTGNRWPILGVVVAWGLIVATISGIIGVGMAFAPGLPVQLIQWVWEVVAGSFSAVYAAILYHDLRAVREGIGIDEIASVFD